MPKVKGLYPYREDIVEHIRKYPYEPAFETAKRFGYKPRTIHTMRWFVRHNFFNGDMPSPNADKHAEQIKRDGPPAEPKFPYNHRTLAEVEQVSPAAPGFTPERKAAIEEKLLGPRTLVLAYDEEQEDAVHPIQTIDYIKDKLSPDEFAGYCKGSAMRCIAKAHGAVHPEKNLEHARWYLDHLLKVRGNKNVAKGEA